jgi:hypothetical protein
MHNDHNCGSFIRSAAALVLSRRCSVLQSTTTLITMIQTLFVILSPWVSPAPMTSNGGHQSQMRRTVCFVFCIAPAISLCADNAQLTYVAARSFPAVAQGKRSPRYVRRVILCHARNRYPSCSTVTTAALLMPLHATLLSRDMSSRDTIPFIYIMIHVSSTYYLW